jgi:uncharacterized protein YbjT (DUF2867 family)
MSAPVATKIGRPRIAVAGASGFVGKALLPLLARRGDVIALTRVVPASASRGDEDAHLSWRRCDLFSVRETEAALEGVDYAYYLVHSMMPSARLTQASFSDLDLLLADNFARAAERAGVRQILYLGGLVPEGAALSAHLRSRVEVEETLRSRRVPLTALRAGLVVGSEGSSFQILVRLVRRLPFMFCPRWTQNPTQPIALSDALHLLEACLGDERTFGATFDIGGPDVMSYRDMILRTAQLLGLRRRAVPVPFMTTTLSRLWVSLVTRTPRALVTPLIESLQHAMVARERGLQRRLGLDGLPFDAAVRDALAEETARAGAARIEQRRTLQRDRSRLRLASNVRSVQRLPLPPGRDARWVALEYLAWLPRFVWPCLRVEVDADGLCRFRLYPLGIVALVLRLVPERSALDRQLFVIEGGALRRRRDALEGRLEFREVLGGRFLLAAIHDYTPTLPWWLYNLTQARVHLWVMRGFARHLARIAPDQAAISAPAPPTRPDTSGRTSP